MSRIEIDFFHSHYLSGQPDYAAADYIEGLLDEQMRQAVSENPYAGRPSKTVLLTKADFPRRDDIIVGRIADRDTRKPNRNGKTQWWEKDPVVVEELPIDGTRFGRTGWEVIAQQDISVGLPADDIWALYMRMKSELGIKRGQAVLAKTPDDVVHLLILTRAKGKSIGNGI